LKLPVLALFERALRIETRSAMMCWARVGLLVVILFVLFPIQTMARYGLYGAPGLRFFQEMVWVNFVFISLAGLSYFASAITEEKEEMMLGLLRMTDLNPAAILLGKSTSRLIGATLLLLGQVPFILLAVTLGGVSLNQIVAAYGTLFAYLFLLCNLALLFSVVFRNTVGAALTTGLLLLMFFVGPYWAAALEQGFASSYQVNLARGGWPILTKLIALWRGATPSDRLGAIFRTGFAGPVFSFQVVSNLVLGFLFFLLAWAVFDLFTREQKDEAPARGLVLRRRTRRSGIPSHMAGPRAITWKDFTFISGGKFGVVAKLIAVGLLIAMFNEVYLQTGNAFNREFTGFTLIWLSLITTGIWLAIEASRVFKTEVRWKTLSSLMTLPISVRELAYRKVAGVLVGTLPLLAYFALGVALVPDKVHEFITDILKERMGVSMLLIGVLQYVLFLHLTAFLSLVIKRGALPLAIAIQYIGGMIFIGFISAFLIRAGGGNGEGIVFFVGFLIVLITAILHAAIGYRLQRVAAEE
jgi:hypothetical protein